jgi:protein TonB
MKGTLIGCVLATLALGACSNDTSSSPAAPPKFASQIMVSVFTSLGTSQPTPMIDADSLRGLPPEPVRRLEGTVVLEVMVDANGQVTDVTVRQAADPRLTDASVAAARRWTYKPATANGQPIAGTVRITIVFRLP